MHLTESSKLRGANNNLSLCISSTANLKFSNTSNKMPQSLFHVGG